MKSFIDHTGWYMGCWLMFFFGAGIVMYIIDRAWLQGLYRWFYNMTHETPLPVETGRSVFVFGHKTARKVLWATIISTVQSAGLFFFTGFHSNPFVELVLWFLEIPAMVLGFAAGAVLYPYWLKRKGLYALADKFDDALEKGEFKPKFPAALKPTPPAAANPAATPSSPAPAPVAKVPEKSPRQVIEEFTKGK
jgi:hypothetical protein